jgi:hypothetical protein
MIFSIYLHGLYLYLSKKDIFFCYKITMNSEKQQDLLNENVKTVQLVYNSFRSRDFKAILEVLSNCSIIHFFSF